MKTKVIFRTWKAEPKTVIAFFPEEIVDNYHGYCNSYEHIGQHGGADYKGLLKVTRLAKSEEFKELLRELQNIGYNLEIRKRA